MDKKRIAVLFGGKSTEHEVSIITALQAIENLDRDKYDIIPIYISKSGKWILGNQTFFKPASYTNLTTLENNYPTILINPDQKNLLSKTLKNIGGTTLIQSLDQIDIFFPIFHGTNGEDGTMQGLLELLDKPYIGCGLTGSVLGMDKIIQKQLFAQIGIPQVKYIWFYRNEWQSSKSSVLSKLSKLNYPLFVKPANGGSSIGITRVTTRQKISDAIDVACCYDRKILVEESAEGFMEINISVMGNSGDKLETSVCEYVPSKGLLTYEEKYLSKGSKTDLKSAGMASGNHIIPAPLKRATSDKIAQYAKSAFSVIDGFGFTRADFLVSPDEKTIYINELNTIPGSLAHFLWTKNGITYSQYLDKLINLAEKRHLEKSKNTYTFSSNILSNLSSLTRGKLKV